MAWHRPGGIGGQHSQWSRLLVSLATILIILRELHPLTGRGRLVFPGAWSNGRPMTDNAILAAMRRIALGEMTPVGNYRGSSITISFKTW
jgi:hypothetical protein